MAGFVEDVLVSVVAGSEIHSAILHAVVQQMIFVIVLVTAKKCVNSENPMPNRRSHGTRQEIASEYPNRSERDVVILA